MNAKFILTYLILNLTIFCLACAPKHVPPAAVEPAYITHTVKHPGETLGVIATWYTGKSTNWQEIKDSNPGLNEKRIRLGDDIRIPLDLVVKSDAMPESFVPKTERPALMALESQEPQLEDKDQQSQEMNNTEVANTDLLNEGTIDKNNQNVELASQPGLEEEARAALKPQQSQEQPVIEEVENENVLEEDSNAELLSNVDTASQIEPDLSTSTSVSSSKESEISLENSEQESEQDTVQQSEQKIESSTSQNDPLWEAALDIKAKNKSSQ